MKKKPKKKLAASTSKKAPHVSKKAPRSLPVLHKHIKETRERKLTEQTAKQKAARKKLQSQMKKILENKINKTTDEIYTPQEIKKVISGPSVLLQKEVSRMTRTDKYYFAKDKNGRNYAVIKGKGRVTFAKLHRWKKQQDYWATVRSYAEFHEVSPLEARSYLKEVYVKIHTGKRDRSKTLRALKQTGYRKGKTPTALQQAYLDQLARIRKHIAEAYRELYS